MAHNKTSCIEKDLNMGFFVEIIAIIFNALRSIGSVFSPEKKEGEENKPGMGARIKGWFGGAKEKYKDNWDKHYDSDSDSKDKDS